MRLTTEDIKAINSSLEDSWNQGIFTEPNWVPNDIKEPVIYMRWNTGGYSGGNCWGGESQPYEGDPEPKFEVLDAVLKKLCPDISYLQYRGIEGLIRSSDEVNYEYYGNLDNYSVKFIVLEDLYKFLGI